MSLLLAVVVDPAFFYGVVTSAAGGGGVWAILRLFRGYQKDVAADYVNEIKRLRQDHDLLRGELNGAYVELRNMDKRLRLAEARVTILIGYIRSKGLELPDLDLPETGG